MGRRLSGKQQKFIDAYLGEANFNATRAAEIAGYAGNGNTLGQIGHKLVKNGKVAKEISTRLKASAMSANEVLMRLGEHARADYKPYLDEDGEVDLKRLLADNKGHLVKGIKKTKFGNQVEFYSSQPALSLIAKHHGLLIDKIDQRTTNIEIDLSSLTDEQLKRLASGEDIAKILAGD